LVESESVVELKPVSGGGRVDRFGFPALHGSFGELQWLDSAGRITFLSTTVVDARAAYNVTE
jgi:hypothetical protein